MNIKIKRGKRIKTNPINDAALIYASSVQDKYNNFFSELRKHPHKLYEYHTGIKLSLWRRLYIDISCKFKRSAYEKQQIAINKAIKPFIRKK